MGPWQRTMRYIVMKTKDGETKTKDGKTKTKDGKTKTRDGETKTRDGDVTFPDFTRHFLLALSETVDSPLRAILIQ